MTTIVYFHGFGSNNKTAKVGWLAEQFPQHNVVAPNIPPTADEAYAVIDAFIKPLVEQDDVILTGTSMGGFWANIFAQKYALRAVIMNPALTPDETLRKFVGAMPFPGYTATDFTVEDAQKYGKYVKMTTFENFNNKRIVLLEEADELLDSKITFNKYKDACKTVLIPGGEHKFVNLGILKTAVEELVGVNI